LNLVFISGETPQPPSRPDNFDAWFFEFIDIRKIKTSYFLNNKNIEENEEEGDNKNS